MDFEIVVLKFIVEMFFDVYLTNYSVLYYRAVAFSKTWPSFKTIKKNFKIVNKIKIYRISALN